MDADNRTVDGMLMDDDNASYDKAAKRFLARKMLLAWILKYLVAEFRDCSIKDIAEKYIEGDPTLTAGTIPVAAGLTNAARKAAKKKPGNIKGSRNEDGSTAEGAAISGIMFRIILLTFYHFVLRYPMPDKDKLPEAEKGFGKTPKPFYFPVRPEDNLSKLHQPITYSYSLLEYLLLMRQQCLV